MSHPPPDPRRWRILALLGLAQFMVILDVTVVNVALPTIGRELDLTEGGLPWLIAAYTLPFAALLLLGGRLADFVGRRVVLLAGLVLFSLGSLASGLAQDAETLIAARAGQGIGAALLSPAALSVVAALFGEPAERRRALTIWGGIGAAGGAAGLLLGGLMTELLGWRSVFLINVPIGITALALVPAWLEPMRGTLRRVRDLDLMGAVLAATAFGGLVLAANRAAAVGWDAAIVWAGLIAGTGALAGFFLVESRVFSPLVPLGALRRPTLLAGSGLMLVGAGTIVSAFYLGSLQMQHGLGYDALETGLAFLPVTVVIALGAHAGGHLAGRLGVRATAATGLALASAGALLLATSIDGNAYLTGVLPGLLVLGFGLGSTFVSATTTAMSGIAEEQSGLASGMTNTAHELGASFGVAVLGAIGGGAAVAADVETAFAVAGSITAFAALVAAFAFPRVALGERPAFAHH
jgi:EmrB/QacA subfamily drug resistance transporter